LTVAVVLFLLLGFQAQAQQPYPNRPIRLIVPFSPGSGPDIGARMIATKLSERLHQQVVVENKPGAGGRLGTELAARSTPDGYTLILVSSAFGTHPSLYKLSYDSIKGFEPIVLASQQPLVVVINTSLPIKSIGDLIAYAKANPGKLNYMSAGIGSMQHFATELFKNMAHIDIVHVPYRSSTGKAELLANQVQIEFGTILPTLPFVKSGQVRALAVTTDVRSPTLPDVPTLAEAGVPGYAVSGWYAILAPAHTPREIVTLLNREVVTLLQSPDLKEQFAKQGTMVVGSTPQELTEYLKQEIAKWTKLVKEANIKVEEGPKR
jgi:tripartite-type tricarboxylate transporter receptor subunit TctC